MVRPMRRGAVGELERIAMQSRFADAVTPGEYDASVNGNSDPGDPKAARGRRNSTVTPSSSSPIQGPTLEDPKTATNTNGVTRTTRGGGSTTGETTTSRSATTGGDTNAALSEIFAAGNLGGQMAGGNLFERGMYDALGGGNSDLFTEWGIAPAGYDEMEDPELFSHMWEQQYGNDPTLDKRDIQRYQAQQEMRVKFGGGIEDNAWDDLGALTENGATPGGMHMTYSDSINMIAGNPEALAAFGVKDDDYKVVNNLILGSSLDMYPSYVQDAVAGRLNESSLSYRSAQQRGEFNGSYAEWLQQDGTAAWLGGM